MSRYVVDHLNSSHNSLKPQSTMRRSVTVRYNSNNFTVVLIHVYQRPFSAAKDASKAVFVKILLFYFLENLQKHCSDKVKYKYVIQKLNAAWNNCTGMPESTSFTSKNSKKAACLISGICTSSMYAGNSCTLLTACTKKTYAVQSPVHEPVSRLLYPPLGGGISHEAIHHIYLLHKFLLLLQLTSQQI